MSELSVVRIRGEGTWEAFRRVNLIFMFLSDTNRYQ